MLNLVDIENTIEELENGETTFDVCTKLASLYIVREHMYSKDEPDTTEVELQDILPQYRVYKEVKLKYQKGEIPIDRVLHSLNLLSVEIREFLHTLYSSTDTEEEREQLRQLFDKIRVNE